MPFSGEATSRTKSGGVNLTSPCPWCHLDGVHLGRIRVTGEAPGELVWTIGRTPIMEVRGREKRLAA